MGGKGGSTGTSTQYSGVQIPQEVLQRYNKATDRAEDVSKQTWQNYGGEFVAPVNATQIGGYNTMMGGQNYTNWGFDAPNASINQGVNAASPYLDQASGSINTGQAQGQALGAAGLGQAAEAYTSAQPFNAAAAGGFGNAMAGAQPYNQAAANLSMQGMQGVDPSQLNTQQFMNPYQQQVIEATMGQLGQQQAQQRMDQRGSMIREGSFGGDRSGIANANMVNQQNLATGSVLSNLNSQNYGQALAAAQQQQGVGLGAAQANRAAIQQGAGQMLGIGQQGYSQGMGYGTAMQGLGQQGYTQGMGQAQYTGQMGQQMYGQGVGAGQAQQGLGAAQYGMWGDVAAKQAALAGQAFGQNMQTAQGQIGFGSLQQQTQQAQDSALYNQWMQERGYPFQTSQFYTNAVMGTGPLSGSNAYSGSFTPQPFFSDDRVKENMEPVGTTHDGQVIYRFNYKGQPGTQLGLSAQEVQRKHPEAVSEHGGVKAVDYSAATEDAAERPHKAAGGPLGSDPFGYQPPNPGLAPGVGILGQPASMPSATPTTGGSIGDIVALQRASLAANAPGSGPPSNAGSAEALKAGQDAANATTAAAGPMAGMGAADTAAPGGPATPGSGGAVYPTSFVNPMDGGSANGATGDSSGSATGEAGSVGAGVGTAAGDAGAAAAAAAADAGPGSDASSGGPLATGGRVGFAKAGKVPSYQGGLGGSDDFWAQQAAAQRAAYGDLFPREQTSAGVGNASILGKIEPAKASAVLKPPESKTPAPAAKATTDQATDALDTVSKGAKSIEGLYSMGKDALVGSKEKGTPQRGDPGQGTPAVGKPGEAGYIPASKDYRPASVDYRPASSDYKPATGGLIGHGGSRSKPGWIDKQLESDKPEDTKASKESTNGDGADGNGGGHWDEKEDYTEADLGPSLDYGYDGGLDIDTEIADWSGYARGGRPRGLGRARFSDAGEVKEDAMPFAGSSLLPGGSYDVDKASKGPEVPDPAGDKGTASGKKKSSGAGKAIGSVIGGIAGSFVGCTMCGAALGGLAGGAAEGDFAKDGGRIEGRLCSRCSSRTRGFADGGEVNDNEPPEPGLAQASSAMEDADNVHWGVFSRSQGHKMVGRAASKKRARNMVDKHDNAYGAYDHFIKPIAPTRKRAYGGRAGFDIGGTIEDEEAENALVARRLLERERERGLGAAETTDSGAPVDRDAPVPSFMQAATPAAPAPTPTPEPAALGAARPEVVEPTPDAQQIIEGMKKPGLASADPGVPVAEGTGTVVPPPPPAEQPDPSEKPGGTIVPPPPPAVVTPTQTPKPVEVPQQAVPTTRGGNSFNIGNVKTFDGKDTFQAPPDFNSGVALTVYNASTYAGKFNQGKPMTIAEIGARWAPVGSKDDPNNLNANWPKNVAAAYKAAGQDPNVPVDFSNPAHAAAFAKAVHQAEHGKSLDIGAYATGVQMANDPNVRKGFGSSGVGGGATTPAGTTPDTPSGTALGAANTVNPSADSRSMYGQNKDWWDRNESWTLPALHGIGKMLSSQSRTLAGSIGEGLAGGTEKYVQTGQRQQSIDIQGQQARTQQASAVAEQIRLTQAKLATDPNNKTLQDLLQNYVGHWNALMGNKAMVPKDIFKPGDPGQFGDPRFELLNDAENPAALWRSYQATGDEKYRAAAVAAVDKLKREGFGGGKGGGTVRFDDLHQAHLAQEGQRKASNIDAEIAAQAANPISSLSREAATQAIEQLKTLIEKIGTDGTAAQKGQLPQLQQRLNDMRARFGQARGGRIGRAFGGPTWTPPDEDPNMPPAEGPPDVVAAPPGLGTATTDGAPPPPEPEAPSPLQQAQWKPPPPRSMTDVPMPKLEPPPPAPTTNPADATTEEGLKKRLEQGYLPAGEREAIQGKLIEFEQQRVLQQRAAGMEMVKEARNHALGLAQQQRALQDMKHSINALPESGLTSLAPYAEARKHLAAVTNAVTQTLFNKNVFDPNDVAGMEEAIKAQTILAGAQSSAIGQHSQGIMRSISEASPGPGLSKLGYQRVAAGMEQTMQMIQDRATFFEKWFDDPKNKGNMTGASEAFLASTDGLRKYSDAAILSTIPQADRDAVAKYRADNPNLTDAELRAALASVDAKWGKGSTDIILKKH